MDVHFGNFPNIPVHITQPSTPMGPASFWKYVAVFCQNFLNLQKFKYFSLKSHRVRVESTSQKSACLFVCLFVCHHFKISNIGPLYHPRITPDPTYHILLLWYDILLMGLHFYFTSNIFDWPGEQWISTLRAFAVPLLRFSSSVIHRDSFLASTISSSNDHSDGGEKIEKNTFMK